MAKKLKDDLPASNVSDGALVECLTWQAEIEAQQMRLKAKQAAGWRKYEGLGVDKGLAKDMHGKSKLDPAELERVFAKRAQYERIVFGWGADGQGDFVDAIVTGGAVTGPLSDSQRKLSVAR